MSTKQLVSLYNSRNKGVAVYLPRKKQIRFDGFKLLSEKEGIERIKTEIFNDAR